MSEGAFQKVCINLTRNDRTCCVEIIYISRKYANNVIVLNEFSTNHSQRNDKSHSLIGYQAIITL